MPSSLFRTRTRISQYKALCKFNMIFFLRAVVCWPTQLIICSLAEKCIQSSPTRSPYHTPWPQVRTGPPAHGPSPCGADQRHAPGESHRHLRAQPARPPGPPPRVPAEDSAGNSSKMMELSPNNRARVRLLGPTMDPLARLFRLFLQPRFFLTKKEADAWLLRLFSPLGKGP